MQDDRILRIFDRKGSFTVHGKEDTQYIARTFHKGTAVIKHMGKGQNQLETIVLNRSLYEQLLRDALVAKANRVVELYEGHGSSWQLCKYAAILSLQESDKRGCCKNSSFTRSLRYFFMHVCNVPEEQCDQHGTGLQAGISGTAWGI